MNRIDNYLTDKGIILKELGLNEYALSKYYSFEFIKILKEEKIAILGGDVYFKDKGDIYYTYDNWYIQRKDNESYDSYLQRSINVSLEYIKSYSKINIDESNLYFVFVIERDFSFN
jgi:hypothetical protein